MAVKLFLLVIFFAVMVSVGLYSRRHATSVDGFVLGGRSVGPWLTAFAYGTSYFSAVVFVGYAGQFGWKYGMASTWIGLGNAVIGSLLAWVVLGRRTKVMTTAGFFRGEVWEQGVKDCGVGDRVCVPDPVYGIGVQRPVKAFRDGVQHSLYILRYRYGGVYRGVCDPGRLYGDGHQ